MNRSFLRVFYVVVQFVMLAVSIPKVATLFHAYNPDPIGPTFAGLDLTSWMVGIMIDCCAAVTTWAAMTKYDESRSRSALLAPGIIILCCTGLSVVANYEDAALVEPAQYAHVSLFTHPALLINPILISAPPIIVFLLIMLVPSVLAQKRFKTAEEIEMATAEQKAKIIAHAELLAVRADANAKVRSARIKGFQANMDTVANRVQITEVPRPVDNVSPENVTDRETPTVPTTRAVWNTLSLKERVLKSGVISLPEIAEVLGISRSHARNLAGEVKAEAPSVPGRTGVPYQALIEALYEKRSRDSFAQAKKLESALGLRRRKGIHVVPGDEQTVEVEGTGENEEAETLA